VLRWVPVVLGTAVLAGAAAVGARAATEQPAYEIVGRIGDVELRCYGPRLAAETTVTTAAADEGESPAFSRLAGYIFGANVARSRIAMTAPVAAQEATTVARPASTKIAMTAPVATDTGASGTYTMRFFLPAALTRETAPVPTDPRVALVEVPAETMAVLRFSGSRRDAAVAKQRARLQAALRDGPWQAAGAPVAFFYDSPWTPPFLRRNEVAVTVAPRS
jgi:hypothetical protein